MTFPVRLPATLLLVMFAAAPLLAELKIASRVSVSPEPLDESLFEIPAGCSKVVAPVSGIVAK